MKRSEASDQLLNVEILLEHTRGSRGEDNSRTMLLPLVQNFTDAVKVSLYHSPSLRGLLKLLLPERFNETVALTHLKVYLTDDTLIMSGWVPVIRQEYRQGGKGYGLVHIFYSVMVYTGNSIVYKFLLFLLSSPQSAERNKSAVW